MTGKLSLSILYTSETAGSWPIEKRHMTLILLVSSYPRIHSALGNLTCTKVKLPAHMSMHPLFAHPQVPAEVMSIDLGRCPCKPWKEPCNCLGKEFQGLEWPEFGLNGSLGFPVKAQLLFLGLSLWRGI